MRYSPSNHRCVVVAVVGRSCKDRSTCTRPLGSSDARAELEGGRVAVSIKQLNLASRKISRRQFFKYTGATTAGAWLASQGLFARAQGGGTLVWLGHQEVAGIGPNDIGPDVQSAVIYNVLNPLVNQDYRAQLQPVLATSYEVAADGLSYTFHLHQGVQFHDGSELTAEDVKYTFEYYSQEGEIIASRFNPNNTDVVAAIRDYTGGFGADLCIEAAGRPETALNCFAAVKTGGQVIFNGEQGTANLSISEQFIRRDITATGSWFYHFAEFHDMLRLFRSGLPVSSLITDVYPLDDVNTAFADFAAGKTGKAVISYGLA